MIKQKYMVEYANGDLAGFTDCHKSLRDIDEDLIFWRGGTNWKPSEFETLQDAKDIIEATNNYRKIKGFSISKFRIKRLKQQIQEEKKQ